MMRVPAEKVLATFSFSPDPTVEPLPVIEMWVDGDTPTTDPAQAKALVCLNCHGLATVCDPDEGYLRRVH